MRGGPPEQVGAAPPVASVFVVGTNRSGSTLLCELLTSTGVAGMPDEYFWPGGFDRLWSEWGISSYRGFLAELRLRAVSPNGVFGAKLVFGYLEETLASLRALAPGESGTDVELLARWFAAPRFVATSRVDTVAQAVSWTKALQTGQWRSTEQASAEPSFDFEQIDTCVRWIRESAAGWERWFARNGVTPHRVDYEELAANPAGVTERVLDALALPGRERARPATTALRVQRDRTSANWVARYRELAGLSAAG